MLSISLAWGWGWVFLFQRSLTSICLIGDSLYWPLQMKDMTENYTSGLFAYENIIWEHQDRYKPSELSHHLHLESGGWTLHIWGSCLIKMLELWNWSWGLRRMLYCPLLTLGITYALFPWCPSQHLILSMLYITRSSQHHCLLNCLNNLIDLNLPI